MNQADFGLLALLLNMAILMALTGFILGRGTDGMQRMSRFEKIGTIAVVLLLLLPLLFFGYLGQVTIGVLLLAMAITSIVLLIGTDLWWATRRRLQQMHRPVVASYMLSLDQLVHEEGKDSNVTEKGAVWVYAWNSGKGRAKEVRIETNIPTEMVQSDIWQDGTISRSIDVLHPELPVCIGVVRPIESSVDRHYWIAFEYMSESEICYKERYELEM